MDEGAGEGAGECAGEGACKGPGGGGHLNCLALLPRGACMPYAYLKYVLAEHCASPSATLRSNTVHNVGLGGGDLLCSAM